MVRRQRKPENNLFLKSWPLLAVGVATFCASFPAFQRSHRAKEDFPLSPANSPTATAELSQVGFGMDQTQVESPAQDGTGDIWAIKPWTTEAFFKWNGNTWNRQSFEPARGYSPVTLQRVQDGTVLCVWQLREKNNPTKQFLLTEHKGNDSHILARWQGDDGQFRLFRSSRATWITSWGKHIYRIENGTVARVYDIESPQLHEGNVSHQTLSPGNNPLEMLEDARGHIWFWSNGFESGFNNLSLRGLLEFDGQQWLHHPQLQGIPDKPLAALVERDAHTFWLAERDGGLFEFDIDTLMGKRVADPLPRAFEEIQTIRQLGGGWYFIANSPEVIEPSGDSSQRQSDVWRWQAPSTNSAQGHFKRILHGVDYSGQFGQRPNRPLLATNTGLWIGALSGGAWWLPFAAKQPPVHIDWRQDLLLADVNALFLQNDGRLMASTRGSTVPDLLPYLGVTPSQTPQAFTAYGPLLEAPNHHLWRVPSLKERILQEWDGKRWKSYSLPAPYHLNSLFYLSADTRGRIWLLPDSKDGPAALLTPSTRSWQFYPSFRQALQKQLKQWGVARFVGLKVGNGQYQVPRAFAPDRLAFHSPNNELCFFDGQGWHTWNIKDIVGAEQMEYAEWEGTPYFDATGVLCANIDDTTWQWTPTTSWAFHEYIPYPFATPEPPAFVSRTSEATLHDSSGVIWELKNRQLWKAAWGLHEPMPNSSALLPLRDGRKLTGVFLDSRGVALLATGNKGSREYFWTSDLPPDTRISVTPQSLGLFRLRFRAIPQIQEKHWFRWRLTGGEWSKPQTDPILPLSIGSAGTYRVEVAAINAHLQIDLSPATTTLRVPVASRAQLARLLSMLSSPNYAERENAVKSFSIQSATALPFLRAARRTANADLQWWIDAALQEIAGKAKSQ